MFSVLWWTLDLLQVNIALCSFSFEMKRAVIPKYLRICLLAKSQQLTHAHWIRWICVTYSSTYIHRLTLNLYEKKTPLPALYRYLFCSRSFNSFFRKALIFVTTSYWTHCVTSDSKQEGYIAGTKREVATKAMRPAELSSFNAHRWSNGLPWNITIKNHDKGAIPSTKTAVHRTMMQDEDFQVHLWK